MEETKTIDFSERPDEKGVITSCPWWIFGDEDSAITDLSARFEVVE